MWKSIITKLKDLLNGRSYTQKPENNSDSTEKDFTRERLNGTPFDLVNQNNEWFLVMGNNRITEGKKTEHEAIQLLETDKWLILTRIAAIAVEKTLKVKDYERIKKAQDDFDANKRVERMKQNATRGI